MKIKVLMNRIPLVWKWSSFRTKLVVSIIGVVSLSLATVLSIYYYRMTDAMESNTYRGLEQLTAQSVSTIELYLESVRNQAWHFFSDEAAQQFVSGMRESDYETRLYYRDKLSEIVRHNSLVRAITLHDLTGMSVSNDGHTNEFEKETDGLIQSALDRNGIGAWEITQISTGLKGPDADYTLSYTQALKAISIIQQTEIGMIRIDLGIKRLQNAISALKMDYDGQFYIVNPQGVIILAENSAELGQSLAEDPWFQAYTDFHSMTGRSVVQSGGKSWISLYHKFHTTDWIVVGRVPLDEVLASVNRVRNQTLSIGIISLAITLVIAYAVALSVTRPLKVLRSNMQQLKRGVWDASIPVTSRDEIGYLQQTFNQMSKEIHRLITRVYKIELLKQEAEIKALQSQINPHFLYNALGTIDSFAAMQGDKRISSISQALGGIFRYNISGGKTALVKEEIEQMRLYLSIQQIRYGDRLHYEIDVDPKAADLLIPKLLLQPLVENAMIHGIEPKRERSMLRIGVQLQGETEMHITIEDNGLGMTPERLCRVQANLNQSRNGSAEPLTSRHGGASIGLVNVGQRIELFYGSDYGIQLTSRENEGTVVRLVIAQAMEGGDPIV